MLDVIICGAGVAGSRLAQKLSSSDVNYISIDPREVYLKDSGSVSEKIFKFYPSIKVKSRIRKIDIVGQNERIEFKRKKPFAYVIDRINFWKMLRKRINIKKERVLSVEQHKNFVIVKTNKNKYKSKIVVGADGALSVVRRSLGINTDVYFGMFGFSRPVGDSYIVHFNKKFSDVFSWQIPDGEYGMIVHRRNVKKSFKFFEKTLGVKSKRYFLYPLSLGIQKIYFHRVVLVGDAASQLKPITFGGIIYSLEAADILSRHIIRFLNDDNYNLKKYEDEWKKEFGQEFMLGFAFRRAYDFLPQKIIDAGIKLSGELKNKINSNKFDYDIILKSILYN